MIQQTYLDARQYCLSQYPRIFTPELIALMDQLFDDDPNKYDPEVFARREAFNKFLLEHNLREQQ